MSPGEITFRALLASLEESGEDAKALQTIWAADAAGWVGGWIAWIWPGEKQPGSLG